MLGESTVGGEFGSTGVNEAHVRLRVERASAAEWTGLRERTAIESEEFSVVRPADARDHLRDVPEIAAEWAESAERSERTERTVVAEDTADLHEGLEGERNARQDG